MTLEQGWTDALRHVHPDARIYSFWDHFRQHTKRDRGLRIDHLLLTRCWLRAWRTPGVDRWVRLREKAGDHGPTWVELAVEARKKTYGGGAACADHLRRIPSARSRSWASTDRRPA